MAATTILHPKSHLSRTSLTFQDKFCNTNPGQNGSTASLVYDIESFKKRMNPVKRRIKSSAQTFPNTVAPVCVQAVAPVCVQVVAPVCVQDVEDFKLKFHPRRTSNQENQPLVKSVKKDVTAAGSKTSTKDNGKDSKNMPRFLCDVCSAMFKTWTNLKEHVRIHSANKEYKCHLCDYGCHRERNLKIHILTHAEKKPIQCPMCDYTCIQNFQLKAHLLLHQTPTPFHCTICSAKYKKEAGLKVHMLTHSNQYKFKCQICQHETNRFADYRRHLLIHSKCKPEKCPMCSYACIRQSRLKAHMLIHRGHADNPVLSSLEKNVLRCDVCDYICTTASRLRKHKTSHKKQAVRTCTQCGYTCAKASELKNHVQIHRENPMLITFTQSPDQHGPITPELMPQVESLVPVEEAESLVPEEEAESLVKCEDNQQGQVEDSMIYADNHNQAEMFTNANHLYTGAENQTLLLTASVGQSDGQVIVQSDQGILLAPTNQSWEEEGAWSDSFSVADLSSFSFDPISLQQAPSLIVTVVKEEANLPLLTETVKEEVEEPVQRLKMYHCDICSFGCDYKSTFKKHMRKHAELKNFKCAHCHYMCDQLSRMKKHLISHTDQKLFHCQICQFGCKSKSTLQHHMLSHTQGRAGGAKSYHCPRCDYSCKSSLGLKSHFVKHTGANPFQCEVCQESFMTEYLLKKHKFSHGVKPYQCQYCSYSCVQRQQMNTHLLQHTYEYPFCCSLCNAKYKKQDSLKVHIMSEHEKKHRYSCQLCNYVGNRAADFREHVLTHSERKPHQCPHCSYSCIRPTQLKKHLHVHDKDPGYRDPNKAAANKKKTFACHYCSFSSSRSTRMRAHLDKVHLTLPDVLLTPEPSNDESTPDFI